MATIYDISARYSRLLEAAEGDLTGSEGLLDEIINQLEATEDEFEEKCENTAMVLRELAAQAAAIKAEEKRLAERRKSIENNIEAIKSRLLTFMVQTGKTNFKTTLFSFSARDTSGALVVDNESKIPANYLIPQPPKIDKAAVKAAIKSGVKVDGAHIEPSQSLTIK